MKVGDLVKAPYLLDHDESLGLVIDLVREEDDFYLSVKVLFASGSRTIFSHLVEVISESR